MNLIGIGNCGCAIAKLVDAIEGAPYNVFYIDSTEHLVRNFYLLPPQESPEDYEASVPDMSSFFTLDDEPTWVVVGGGGFISAACLKILQQIKDKTKIHILYIQPELEFLNGRQKLIERAVFHVLQEYARSGALEEICLVSNQKIADVLQNTTILNYYQKINELIVHLFHSINVFKHTTPLVSNFTMSAKINRITTLGVMTLQNNQEKALFDLDSADEKCYYVIISREKAETDTKIFNQIKDYIRSQKTGEMKIMYGVYSSEDSIDYCPYVVKSSKIQNK